MALVFNYLKNKRSICPDEISAYLIRETNGNFSEIIKLSFVRPTHTGPVSATLAIAKLVKYNILEGLNLFLSELNLIRCSQHDLRAEKSTLSAIY